MYQCKGAPASVDCLCYGTDAVIENHNIGDRCSQRRGSGDGDRGISARKYRRIVNAIADYDNRLTILLALLKLFQFIGWRQLGFCICDLQLVSHRFDRLDLVAGENHKVEPSF